MPGPLPKPAKLRQRRNKTSTATVLPTEEESAKNKVPPLPDFGWRWHVQVIEDWRVIWTDPVCSEYVKSDIQGLYRYAVLDQDFWSANYWEDRMKIAALLLRLGAQYGLAPMARRQLQWSTAQGEEAVEKTAKIRRRRRLERTARKDPRDVLAMVK